MSLLWVAVVLVVTAAPVFAERVVVVDVDRDTPFAAAELEAALRMRLPDGAPVRLRVFGVTDGVRGAVVRIEASGNVRDVALAGRRGAEAARLVALAAHDLVLDDLAVAPELAPTAPRTSRSSVSVLAGAAAWERTLAGVSIDFVVPRGMWLFALEAGGGQLVGGPLALSTAVGRVGGGARFGALELRAGATIMPVFVGSGAGDRTVLVGGSASARVRFDVSDGVRAVLAVGGDAFATRTTYMLNGMTLLATPHAAPWVAVGLELTR